MSIQITSVHEASSTFYSIMLYIGLVILLLVRLASAYSESDVNPINFS
uniref:Uncharacterized protein n=1 Tax=Nelumbo nucifera TaxID=4432 RepID=A0A822ZGJ1_NELNU|nr:TPA_asm: hypothetical protein HUJ06_002482 [Nelumbo nucifera]